MGTDCAYSMSDVTGAWARGLHVAEFIVCHGGKPFLQIFSGACVLPSHLILFIKGISMKNGQVEPALC